MWRAKRSKKSLGSAVPRRRNDRSRKPMTTVELVQIARTRFERVFAALVDPVRSERTVVLLLGAYVVTWTLYAAIAKSSQDIHPDMGEMVAWSREAGMGTPKHPPLAAWLVRAWFDAFPREDWAYYLLALIMPAIALWITWRISARYLPRDKCVVGIALLTLVPFYNLLALKFNANTVLMPLWAATIWWFLRSLETRYAGWAVLAGIGAAAAMLGKYWSIVLLAALGLTALIHPRRSAYFSSLAPLLTLATGMILLTPHIDWLIANQFMTFSYATEMHSGTTAAAARSAVGFIGGSLGYIALPILFFLLAARPGAPHSRDCVRCAISVRHTCRPAAASSDRSALGDFRDDLVSGRDVVFATCDDTSPRRRSRGGGRNRHSSGHGCCFTRHRGGHSPGRCDKSCQSLPASCGGGGEFVACA